MIITYHLIDPYFPFVKEPTVKRAIEKYYPPLQSLQLFHSVKSTLIPFICVTRTTNQTIT